MATTAKGTEVMEDMTTRATTTTTDTVTIAVSTELLRKSPAIRRKIAATIFFVCFLNYDYLKQCFRFSVLGPWFAGFQCPLVPTFSVSLSQVLMHPRCAVGLWYFWRARVHPGVSGRWCVTSPWCRGRYPWFFWYIQRSHMVREHPCLKCLQSRFMMIPFHSGSSRGCLSQEQSTEWSLHNTLLIYSSSKDCSNTEVTTVTL